MDNLKDKTLLCFDYGLFATWAVKLAKDFGRVLYYCPFKSAFPKTNQFVIGTGFEGVERVTNFWDHLDEVDCFMFPDVYDADLQLHLRDLGKPVWGSAKGEELELLRWQTKMFLKKDLHLPVQPVERVIGIEDLRALLRDTTNKYVKISMLRGDFETFRHDNYELSEPLMDEIEQKLGPNKWDKEFIVEDAIDDAIEVGYDGWTIDGEYPNPGMFGYEIKDVSYVGVVRPYSALPEPVREVNKKLAPVFAQYNYRGFWSSEIRVPKNQKPYLTDPCCFSDDTDVLTDSGWKSFCDLTHNDRVCTLNTSSGRIEYQRPEDYIKFYHSGELICISNKEKGIECLVTQNHGIWRTDRNGNGLFRERADSLSGKGYIPRTGKWAGQEQEFFVLPEYFNSWWSGMGNQIFKTKRCPPVKISMNDWLEFLALYLSEGSLHGKWGVNITQFKYRELVAEKIRKLPFNVTESPSGFVIHSVQLAHYLGNMGLCNSKRIPDYVRRLCPEQIRIFLDSYRLGDGSEHKGQHIYYTTSQNMADDLQELIFLSGGVANIRKRESKGSLMMGRYRRRYDVYVVSQVMKQTRFWFETGSRSNRYISKIPYNGFVYDVTVPNGTVYVRRNGKPFWSSNCRAGSPPSELYQELFQNWAQIIWSGAQGELVSPKPVAKYGVEVLIHSDWADSHWQAVYVEPEVRPWVKLRNLCQKDGVLYVAPQVVGLPEIGAVVAVDDSLLGAIKKVKGYCEKIKGFRIDLNLEQVTKAIDTIKAAEKQGISFSDDPLPTQAQVAAVLSG